MVRLYTLLKNKQYKNIIEELYKMVESNKYPHKHIERLFESSKVKQDKKEILSLYLLDLIPEIYYNGYNKYKGGKYNNIVKSILKNIYPYLSLKLIEKNKKEEVIQEILALIIVNNDIDMLKFLISNKMYFFIIYIYDLLVDKDMGGKVLGLNFLLFNISDSKLRMLVQDDILDLDIAINCGSTNMMDCRSILDYITKCLNIRCLHIINIILEEYIRLNKKINDENIDILYNYLNTVREIRND